MDVTKNKKIILLRQSLCTWFNTAVDGRKCMLFNTEKEKSVQNVWRMSADSKTGNRHSLILLSTSINRLAFEVKNILWKRISVAVYRHKQSDSWQLHHN